MGILYSAQVSLKLELFGGLLYRGIDIKAEIATSFNLQIEEYFREIFRKPIHSKKQPTESKR